MKRDRERMMAVAVMVCHCLLPRPPTIDYGTNNDRETQKTNT